MGQLMERAAEIRDEVRMGRNTAQRVGGLLAEMAEKLETGGVFNDLGAVRPEELDAVKKCGCYVYHRQEYSGGVYGIMVVSDYMYGDLQQVRYEEDNVFRRQFMDEGWTAWGDVFAAKLKRYIDNDTIYWDDAGKVIKSKGGGVPPGGDTFVITAGINPGNVGQCEVTATGLATGDVVSVVATADKSSYTVTARKGGTVTVTVVPKNGYQVQKLNVDTVPQGAVDSYTFTNVQADHTMYVWMEVAVEEQPIDYLVRSDKPGVYYSSTHVALNAIKADYPGGLTKDVTLSCVKLAKERRMANDANKKRNELIFLAVLNDWNRDSLFTLTIDGADMLTYDCASLGGFRLQSVDNIVLNRVSFINFCNYIDANTPDEIGAIMFIGNSDVYSRNLSIWNCSFDGISTTNKSSCSTYTLSTKYTENVYVQGSQFANNAGLTIKMSCSRLATFTKNKIKGVFREGSVGHGGLFDVTNGYQLILEDNEIDGATFRESLMYLTSIDHIYLRRNTIRNGARIIELSANTSIKNVVLDNNSIVNPLNNPVFGWIHELFSSSADIGRFVFNNNTVWMGGNDWMQFVVRFTQADVRSAELYNNIVVDPNPILTESKINLFLFKTLGTLSMGANLLKVSIRDPAKGQTYGTLVSVENPDSNADSITINGSDTRLLSYLATKGYDSGTQLYFKTYKLLEKDNGGAGYEILPDADALYPADNAHVSGMDCDYKQKSASKNSLGCFNLHGTVINEASDSSTGFVGKDYSGQQSFNHTAQYSSMADSVLSLSHNTLNRSRIVRWLIEGSQHKSLSLGKYALIHTLPVLDENEEFIEDELYTIKID